MDLINLQYVINAILFSLIGLGLYFVAFKLFDRITPGQFWSEILDQHNTALAIVVGAVALGISIIVASAIHG